VFALGLTVLFMEQFVQMERIIPLLGVASGGSIALVGGWLLYHRGRALALDGFGSHGHQHHGHAHRHSHGDAHTHSHDGIEHSHIIPGGEVSLASLIVLGVSGGLVPCPSALILMLGAIGVGRAAFGIGLLFAFSAGLALVLTAIGVAVLLVKDRVPQGLGDRNPLAIRLAPVFSAFTVMVLGGVMALNAMGWIKPLWLAA
jgi:ABC-type nickel/cobalt efflux system permease component RcnA